MGKINRDKYLNKMWNSSIDFLPERPYSINGVKFIPRKGTYDFFMCFIPREADIKPHLTLHEQEVFLDVGANVGSYSLSVANDYKNIGVKVIAIEAHPANYEALQKNIEINKLKNIITFNKAVTANKGFVKMYERFHGGKRVGSDIYSICDTFLHSSNTIRLDGKTIQIECDTLDNILRGIQKVDVMKMDIEGAEVLALQGSTNTLNQLRKVIVEVHGNNLEAVKSILLQHNFLIEVTDADMKHVIGVKQKSGHFQTF